MSINADIDIYSRLALVEILSSLFRFCLFRFFSRLPYFRIWTTFCLLRTLMGYELDIAIGLKPKVYTVRHKKIVDKG